MSCWSRIEDDNRVFHRLYMPKSARVLGFAHNITGGPRCGRIRSRIQPTHFMISAKPIASSTPGIANAKSCIIEPIIPFSSAEIYIMVRLRSGCQIEGTTHTVQSFLVMSLQGLFPQRISCQIRLLQSHLWRTFDRKHPISYEQDPWTGIETISKIRPRSWTCNRHTIKRTDSRHEAS